MMDIADGGRGDKPRCHPTFSVYTEREIGKALYRDGSLITETVGGIGRNS
jgi:hypothetical protein